MSAGDGPLTAHLGEETGIANRSAGYIDWKLGGLGQSPAEQQSFLLPDAKAVAHATALQKIVQTAASVVKPSSCPNQRIHPVPIGTQVRDDIDSHLP
jgi:hypothetical protein